MTKLTLHINADDYEEAVNRAVVLANKLRKALDKVERTPVVLSVEAS